MSASSCLLLVLACAGLWSQALGSGTSTNRLRIMKEILEHDRRVMPDGNLSGPVVVTMDFSLVSIGDLDASKGVLQVIAMVGYRWTDSRLAAAFETACNSSIRRLVVPAGSNDGIWTPDIELFNSPKNKPDVTCVTQLRGFQSVCLDPEVLETAYFQYKEEHGAMQATMEEAAPGSVNLNGKQEASVYSDGTTFWYRHLSLSLPCEASPSPFNCTLRFGSWANSASELDVAVDREVDIAEFINSNRRWTLDGKPTMERKDNFYPCCPDNYPTVEVTISLKRRGGETTQT